MGALPGLLEIQSTREAEYERSRSSTGCYAKQIPMQNLFDKIRPRSGAQFTHANTRSKSTQGLRMFSLRSRVSFERYLAPPYVSEPSLVRTTRKLSVLEETCHLLRDRNTEYNTFFLFKAGFILAYDDAQKLAFIHVMCVKWSQTGGGA